MERPATDWMDKRRQAAPQLAAFIQASEFFTLHFSLFTQRVSDSSLFVLHSSLKEYRILHSSFFTLHSKSLYFVTQMDTRFMSFWLNG